MRPQMIEIKAATAEQLRAFGGEDEAIQNAWPCVVRVDSIESIEPASYGGVQWTDRVVLLRTTSGRELFVINKTLEDLASILKER